MSVFDFVQSEDCTVNKVPHSHPFFGLACLTKPNAPVGYNRYYDGGCQLSVSGSVFAHIKRAVINFSKQNNPYEWCLIQSEIVLNDEKTVIKDL